MLQRFKLYLAVGITSLVFGGLAFSQARSLIQGKTSTGVVKDVSVNSSGLLNAVVTNGTTPADVTAANTAATAANTGLVVSASPNSPFKLFDGTTTATVKAASTAAVSTDTSLVVSLNPNTPAKVWDGTNTATVTAASTAAVATDKGLVCSLSPNSPVKIFDGTSTATVTAASTAAAAADKGLVVSVSPNSVVSTNPAAVTSGTLTEVLVQTSSTAVPSSALSGRRSLEIQNLGPNTIFCSPGTPVLNKSRAIAPNSAWALDVGSAVVISCLAATANQSTGAATIATEVK